MRFLLSSLFIICEPDLKDVNRKMADLTELKDGFLFFLVSLDEQDFLLKKTKIKYTNDWKSSDERSSSINYVTSIS